MADITRLKFLGNIYYSSHAYKKEGYNQIQILSQNLLLTHAYKKG